MSEELHQKISQFLDNELNADEALQLLGAMQGKADLHHTMQRYQAISHALKSQVFLPVKTDFAQRIAQAVHDYDPPHAYPYEARGYYAKSSWFALAASVVIVTVLVFKITDPSRPTKLSTRTVAAQLSFQTKQLQHQNQYALNRYTNHYLLLHSNDVAHHSTQTKTAAYHAR